MLYFRVYLDVYPQQSGLIAAKSLPSILPASHRSLTPVESALTERRRVTRLESALPNSLDLKSFRIRTYEKTQGEGVKLLTSALVPLSAKIK
jgi:hypothetical protein